MEKPILSDNGKKLNDFLDLKMYDGLFYLKSIEYKLSVPSLFDFMELEPEEVN